jgi:anti-anti-sigma factor
MTLTELAQSCAPTALAASFSAEGCVAVVSLRGEADVFTLPIVVDALARVIAASDSAVVVDLTHTVFIDSGAALAFARAGQFLDERGRTLTLRSPSRMATRVLSLLELTHLIAPDPVRRAASRGATSPSRREQNTEGDPTCTSA